MDETSGPRRVRAAALTATAIVLALVVSLHLPSTATAAPSSSSSSSLSAPSRPSPQAGHQRAQELGSAITFDDYSVGTAITDQYADRGLVFDSGAFITNDNASPSAPVLSGTPRFFGDIVGRFVVPGTTTPTTVDGFQLVVGFIDDRNSVEITYYGADGTQQGAIRANELAFNTITVSRNGIASFRVSAVEYEGAGFEIDDLRIGRTSPATRINRMAELGDSYSSGEGLLKRSGGPRYMCATDLHKNSYYEHTTVPFLSLARAGDCDTTTGSPKLPRTIYFRKTVTYENLCHRSPVAYPVLIRQALGVSDANSAFIACSGATIKNIGAPGIEGAKVRYARSPEGTYGGELQWKNLADFAGGGAPDLITLGIGGNDMGFSSIIQACLGNNCLDDEVVTSVQAKLDGPIRSDMVTTFKALRSTYPSARIAVFGYPSVIDPAIPACKGLDFSPTQQGIDDSERRYVAETLLPAINFTIADAAAEAGITFIDITAATRGHEICSPKGSWINGLQGGDDKGIPYVGNAIGNESFHPNQDGHAAIAKFFTDNYTDGRGSINFSNPDPVAPIKPTPGAIRWNFGTIQSDAQGMCGTNCLQPQCTKNCQFHIQGQGFAPGATLTVTAHSDPVTLGTVTAASDGSFDATVAAPPGFPPGLHLLEVSGKTSDGQTNYGATTVLVAAANDRKALPGRIRARTRGWRKGAVKVYLTCPRSARRPCAATLGIGRTKSGRAIVRKKVSVKAGRKRTVTLRPKRRALVKLTSRRSFVTVSQLGYGTTVVAKLKKQAVAKRR